MPSTWWRARVTLTSLDTDVDNPSFSHVYFSLDGLNPLTDTAGVCQHEIDSLNLPGVGATNPMRWYISPVISRATAAITVELYDITAHLDGTPAGAPIDVRTGTLLASAPGATGLPEGIANAIDYRADYGADVEFGPGTRPRSRDRNRSYIGPLNTACSDNAATGRAILSALFVTDSLAYMKRLSAHQVAVSTAEYHLAVWSRKNATTKDPVLAFCDNRFDYQRRRADPAPASRVSLPIP